MSKYNGLTKKVKKINGKSCNVWTFDFNLLKTVFNIEAVEMLMDSDDEVI